MSLENLWDGLKELWGDRSEILQELKDQQEAETYSKMRQEYPSNQPVGGYGSPEWQYAQKMKERTPLTREELNQAERDQLNRVSPSERFGHTPQNEVSEGQDQDPLGLDDNSQNQNQDMREGQDPLGLDENSQNQNQDMSEGQDPLGLGENTQSPGEQNEESEGIDW